MYVTLYAIACYAGLTSQVLATAAIDIPSEEFWSLLFLPLMYTVAHELCMYMLQLIKRILVLDVKHRVHLNRIRTTG